jgi:arginine decarboxylase
MIGLSSLSLAQAKIVDSPLPPKSAQYAPAPTLEPTVSQSAQDQARHTYSIPQWAEGYFDVNEQGHMVVHPRGAGSRAIALPAVIAAAKAQGLRIPLLVRFTDVLTDKLGRMQTAFAKAMDAVQFTGGYTAVFPIKVNQQKNVVSELVKAGGDGFGLEAGSKPELVAVLAMSPGGLVICNGYKDREYIRLALIGRKLGMNVCIVIEKANELPLVIEESRKLGVTPFLGVRMRLTSIAGGKWQNTGGDKAKFGLLPRQLLDLIDDLKVAGLSDCLRLLHCHMGSQISNVRDISSGTREMTRYFVELRRTGLPIEFVDVGGGLGVDYEGTSSRSFCSINYGLDQYAQSIVGPLAEACAEHDLPAPRIITEAGRAMTAHHAVLIADVTAVEKASAGRVDPPLAGEPSPLRHLRELYAALETRPAAEIYSDAQHFLQEGQQRFALGQFSLQDRARLDDLSYAIVQGVRTRLREDVRRERELLDEINDKLSDKYFLNFSVFQSVPDVWALEQIFPIVPIERLLETPTRRGVLEDLTCDSDGRIDHYVDSRGIESSLPLHEVRPGEPYYLGLFMVGAYQETLGDMHNLFGDTDSINVRLTADGYELNGAREGDTTDALLRYVGYNVDDLRLSYRAKITAAGLPADEAKMVANALEAGLQGYTYLHP